MALGHRCKVEAGQQRQAVLAEDAGRNIQQQFIEQTLL